MKVCKRILFGLFVIAITLAVATVFCTIEKVDYDELAEVRIKVMGTMVPIGNEYALTFENGTWSASYNSVDWLGDNVDETVADDAFARRIKQIYKEN